MRQTASRHECDIWDGDSQRLAENPSEEAGCGTEVAKDEGLELKPDV